jgi:tRNA (guanine26-N2/guanine27-N2)-dimethyltransferase
VFCLTFKNQKKISEFFKGYGYLVHCNTCGYRSVYHDNVLELIGKCPHCHEIDKLAYAGPLWVNRIHNLEFVIELLALNKEFQYANKGRIDKLLNLIKEEINMPISYYNIHKLSKTLKLSTIPKLNLLIDYIRKKKYQISRTHFDFVSIKTNMDLKLIKKVLLELQDK